MSSKEMSKLKEELDKLCSTPASMLAHNISNYENIHLKLILKDYRRFVKQFEDFYELLAQLVNKVNYIKKDGWHVSKPVQFLIIAYSLETLNSSFDLLVKGHYADSVILIRSVYESLIRVIYLSCYPNEQYSVFYKKRDGTREFNLTGFLKDELNLDWERFYSLMSAISHSNGYQILSVVKKFNQEGQKTPIGLQLKFNKELLEISMNFLHFLLWTFLKATLSLLVKVDDKNITPKLLEKSQTVEKALEKIFILHPNQPWNTAVDDVNYVFKIIKEAEDGNDWKKLIRK